ncbi:FxsA family protein [Nocardioides sp. DS6]|uniref:FxsA family protein n=1 Tax=Nocardioides eburneus TaxID=3231482 RepID=A0ABV3T5H1_9ACTN
MKHRRRLTWILLVAFLVVPIAEIYVLIQVGKVIGAPLTILLLIADSIFGSWLIKREGARAWEALRVALSSGRMPHREVADGALVLLGGALMLSPGFVTDVFGVLLILPLTRPFFRRLLATLVERRLTSATFSRGYDRRGRGDVIQGEVVDR